VIDSGVLHKVDHLDAMACILYFDMTRYDKLKNNFTIYRLMEIEINYIVSRT